MCMSWKGASQMRKRSGLSRTQFLVQWVVLPVLVIVSAAMFVGLVRNQVSIAAKQQELQSLKNRLAAQVTENAELSGTPRAAAGLAADLRTKGLNVTTDAAAEPSAGLVQILPGQLSAGCSLPFAKYAVFTARAFGVSGAQKKKKRNKDALNSLSEISVGDLVVHQNHGIGRYAGIQRMAVQGVTKDYLRIEYDKKDVLYVPVTQLDLLSRYTAPGDSDNVKLSRLGGSD